MISVDLDQMTEHLTALTAGLPDGYGVPAVRIATDSRSDKVRLLGNTVVTKHNIAKAVPKIAEASAWSDLYVGTTVMHRDAFKHLKASASRGGQMDSVGLLGTFADLDIAGDGHNSEKNYPPSHLEVYEIVERVLEPTFLIFSGGGFHAWWLLHEPVIFADEDDRAEGQSILTDWVHTIAHHARELGWEIDDGVGELARILRVAGTTNHKGDPVGVEIVARGPRYHLHELLGQTEVIASETSAENTTDTAPPKRTRSTTGSGDLNILDSVKAASWADIWPNDWTQPSKPTGVRDGEQVEYWTRPGASSTYSAVCWADACHVHSDAVPGLSSGGHSKADVLAWRLDMTPSALSKALIAEARR